MDLYYHPLSTFSQKVLMALYEKNIAFNPKIVNLRNPEKRAEYLKIYPLGKIPFLVCDDDRKVPESSIIIEYLDTHYDSNPQLIPTDKDRSRQVRCTDRMCDFYLTEQIIILFFASFKPEAERNQDAIEKAKFRINVMYEQMDKDLENRTWVMGEELTMADCAFMPGLFYAQDIAPFSDHANIVAYWERLSLRPSCQKIINEVKPLLENFKKTG